MTSKERAALRAQANSLEAVFQAGKGGVNDALIAQTDDALRARELIKLKVLLETTPEPPKAIAQKLAEATGADIVQVIGGSIVLYRYSPALHEPVRKEKPKSGIGNRPNSRKSAVRCARSGRAAAFPHGRAVANSSANGGKRNGRGKNVGAG